MKINKTKTYSYLIILCWITIICNWILKIFGSKEFEIPFIDFNPHLYIRIVINTLLFSVNGLFYSIILLKRKLKFKEILVIVSLSIIDYVITFNMPSPFYILVDLLCYFIIAKLYSKYDYKTIIVDCITIAIIFTIYQAITMLFKNINLDIRKNNFYIELILQIDYYLILLLTALREFRKGETYYERWKTFLVLISKPRRIKELLFKNKKPIQKINTTETEIGFKVFLLVLSIAQLALVGTACYFVNGVIYEYIIIYVSFAIMRAVFGNSYHAETILKCTTLGLVVFVTATRLTLPLWVSVFCNVLIGCLVAYIMYVMYYFVKFTTVSGITIYKGMSLEDLNSLCELYKVDEIDKTILVEYYVKRKHIDTIAYKLNYSTEAIKKRKANILKRIREV